MAARLDTSPTTRMRHLAAQLDLTAAEADRLLTQKKGNEAECASALRALAARVVGKRGNGAYTPRTSEERIVKACKALSPYSDAVDILCTSLHKVRTAPHEERYRKVNVRNGPFSSRVASKPGGTELLYAVGYEPLYGHLVLQNFDAAKLDAALSALDATKATPAYQQDKAKAQGLEASERARALDAAELAAKKAALLAKVPEEPPPASSDHSACLINVRDGSNNLLGKRRFESDNVLEDLVTYVRSLPNTPVDGPLTVTNVTTSPATVFDLEKQRHASLYSLDCWPIAQIRVSA